MNSSQYFEIDVSYNQIAIFASFVNRPFNAWSDAHVAQGFSWRHNSVSFLTVEDGPHRVEFILSDILFPPAADVFRAINVPFDLLGGKLEVASISDGVVIDLEDGNYQLRCEFIKDFDKGLPNVRIILCKSENRNFSVLIADGGLSPPVPLVTDPAAAA